MIIDKLKEDMKSALKAGEKQRLAVIRMLLSELKNARIDAGEDLDEAAEQKVLASYAKKRREAIEAARSGGRDELAEREAFELKTTLSYLPEQLGEDEIRAIVRKHAEGAGGGGAAFGAVMKSVMAELAGRADGKTVSAIVKEELS